MINEQQKQAIAVLNRLHEKELNDGFLLTDEEYFLLMGYVLQEKQQIYYEPQPITPPYYRTGPTTGDPLPMPPYEVTCKFGKVYRRRYIFVNIENAGDNATLNSVAENYYNHGFDLDREKSTDRLLVFVKSVEAK